MYKISNFDGGVVAPGGAYPYGSVKDNPSGTKVNRKMVTDLIQFAQRLAAYAAVVPNELPDNGTNGYQVFESLIGTIGIEIAAVVDPLYITWFTPTINADFDVVYPVTYGKDGFGNVYVRGVLETNTTTPTNEFFTLPAGAYRPTNAVTFVAAQYNPTGPTTSAGVLMVTSAGVVKYALDPEVPAVVGTRIDLNAIIFNTSA